MLTLAFFRPITAIAARQTKVFAQIEKAASAAKGQVGAKAAVLETEDAVSLNSGKRFPMQSVYKVPIAMTVLSLVDAGQLKLDQRVPITPKDFVRREQHSPLRDDNPTGTVVTVNTLLRYAVSLSDGTACDVLLNLVHGPEAVMQHLAKLKVSGLSVASSEKEIGRDRQTQYRNWATPDGAVNLLRALQERRGGMSEGSQSLLLKLMVETPTGPKRLKGLLPGKAVVAHKTGTSGAKEGITAATNDIGIITLPDGRHLAVAVFVSDSPADEPTRERVIARIAKAAWDNWSGQ
jgi:beta-lactamase class A